MAIRYYRNGLFSATFLGYADDGIEDEDCEDDDGIDKGGKIIAFFEESEDK